MTSSEYRKDVDALKPHNKTTDALGPTGCLVSEATSVNNKLPCMHARIFNPLHSNFDASVGATTQRRRRPRKLQAITGRRTAANGAGLGWHPRAGRARQASIIWRHAVPTDRPDQRVCGSQPRWSGRRGGAGGRQRSRAAPARIDCPFVGLGDRPPQIYNPIILADREDDRDAERRVCTSISSNSINGRIHNIQCLHL